MLALVLAFLPPAADIRLEDLDLKGVRQGWGEPSRDKTVDGNPIVIAGKTYEHGLGTHAESYFALDLGGKAINFTAEVGVPDDLKDGRGSVEFVVMVDGKEAFRSGSMGRGDAAKTVSVDLTGAKRLELKVTDAGDGINYDHANWADAVIHMKSGSPRVIMPPVEKPYILTPKPGPVPKLTGAHVFGARPGNPFLFTVTATGDKPITFAAKNLPNGLVIDPSTGKITGTVGFPGTFKTTVSATNKLGTDSRDLRLVIGDTINLTPPMGWNSWNCWGIAVSQEKVLASAQAMAANLKDHGWTYVNIDDGWQGRRGGTYTAIMPNKKFTDMKALTDQIHGLGLKAGIYSTPWKVSYGGHVGGSSDHEDGSYEWLKTATEDDQITKGTSSDYGFGKVSFLDKDVKQWSDWGFDYLKYDWGPWEVKDVKVMSDLLRGSGRDITYSLSNSAPFEHAQDWANLSNCWRTTGDIYDAWSSVTSIWASQDRWGSYAGPGHWNDPDMLVVGKVGWGPSLHPTRLTPNEQYSHISLWCLLSAPLLIGCDLAALDPFTLNLLTNDEVLAVNQDSLGKQAHLTHTPGEMEVWTKPLDDGTMAIGVFNKGESEGSALLDFGLISAKGKVKLRDLWRQQDVRMKNNTARFSVPRHGVMLFKASKSADFLAYSPAPVTPKAKVGGG